MLIRLLKNMANIIVHQKHRMMKTTKLISSCLLLFLAVWLYSGCDKTGGIGPQGAPGEKGGQGVRGDAGGNGEKGSKGDRGDTGAAGAKGPKGDRGDTGVQGPAGPRGEQGPAGVGNVIYSDWIRPTSNDLNSNREIELNVPKLTSAILNSGEVYLFARYRSTGVVYPLEGHQRSYYGFRLSMEVGKIWIYTVTSLARQGTGGSVNYANALQGMVPLVGFARLGFEHLAGACLVSVMQDPDPLLHYDYRYVLIPGGAQAVANIDMANYRDVQHAFGLTN